MSPYELHWDKHAEWWWRCWLVVQHTCPTIPKHQHRDGHRLSQWKSSAPWTKEERLRGRKRGIAGARRRLFRVVRVETFHHRPFVSQPCRTFGPSWGSCRWYGFQCSVRSSRLQHICVFSHQCEIVQYDGRLMLKQDWYDLGEFFLTDVINLLYHLPHIYRANRCFMRKLYNRSVLVIQGIYIKTPYLELSVTGW